MQPGEKWKADLGFRRNRPFATDARNLEAVIQRRKSVFPFVGRQRSGCRHRSDQNAGSIPDIHCSSLTVSNVASISESAAPANDQERK